MLKIVVDDHLNKELLNKEIVWNLKTLNLGLADETSECF